MADTVTLESAKRLATVAEQEATRLGVRIVVSITNPEGNLVLLHRMDGAALASVSVSMDKAYSAAALQGPTHEFSELGEPGGSAYGLHTSDGGRLTLFGGGFPLLQDGQMVGAVGISGASTEEDMDIARAVLEEFEISGDVL